MIANVDSRKWMQNKELPWGNGKKGQVGQFEFWLKKRVWYAQLVPLYLAFSFGMGIIV